MNLVHDDDLTVAELPELDCWELLSQHEFGRLAFHLLDEVHIVPINFAVHRKGLVFRTAEGSKLLGLTINHDVAFEIDQYSGDQARSVVVRGRARELEGREAEAVEQLPLRPWVDTDQYHVIRIEPTGVTGRAFRLSQPH
jgi:nitroimidazol reductase NimA-like FMN-containing flavoprotein (pyridoxamine 5'-phosphate oxidase superfamily)